MKLKSSFSQELCCQNEVVIIMKENVQSRPHNPIHSLHCPEVIRKVQNLGHFVFCPDFNFPIRMLFSKMIHVRTDWMNLLTSWAEARYGPINASLFVILQIGLF